MWTWVSLNQTWVLTDLWVNLSSVLHLLLVFSTSSRHLWGVAGDCVQCANVCICRCFGVNSSLSQVSRYLVSKPEYRNRKFQLLLTIGVTQLRYWIEWCSACFWIDSRLCQFSFIKQVCRLFKERSKNWDKIYYNGY